MTRASRGRPLGDGDHARDLPRRGPGRTLHQPGLSPGSHDFTARRPPANEFAYRGRWRIRLDSATAEGGSLDLNFGARRVYLVLGSPGQPRTMRVLLDGHPIPAADAGWDVQAAWSPSARSASTTWSTCRG